MPTNSIDAVINLKDNYSNTASKVERSTKGLNNSFQSGANNLKELSKNAEMAQIKLKGLGTSAFEMAAAFESFGRLQNMMTSVIGGAYNYSKMMESNAVGISGILQSMVTLDGKTMSWNQSMRMSQDIMSKLRVEALQTAATSEDLIETFRGILGPGLSQGMNIDQIMQFTKVGVNAVRSLGLPSNQYLQELRSILQGNIRPSSSTLATALGITNQDIKKAKTEAGGVYDFLLKRMEGFARATDETQKTVEGRIAILKEAIFAGMTDGGKEVYDQFSGWLAKISESVLDVNDKTKRISLNPDFVEGTKEVAHNLSTLGSYAGKVVNGLLGNAKGLASALTLFATAKIGSGLLNSFSNRLDNITDKFIRMDTWLKGDPIGKQAAKLNDALASVEKIANRADYIAQSNKELGEYLKGVKGSVANLADYYQSMGVSAEIAAKWQKNITDIVLKDGAGYGTNFLVKYYEEEAKNIQLQQQEKQLLQEKKNIYLKIAEIQQKGNTALGDVLSRHSKEIAAANERVQQRENSLANANLKLAEDRIKLADRYADTEAKITEQIRKQTELFQTKRNGLIEKYNADQEKSFGGALKDARKDSLNVYAGGDRSINSVERFGERLKALGAEEEFITKKVNDLNATILNNKDKSLTVVRETVNALMQQAEEEVKTTNAVKQQEESKKKLEASVVKVWEGVEKTTKEIIRQKVEEEKLAEQARMVRDLQMLPGHYNYNGKEFLWNKDNVKTLNELKQTAEGYGLSQERVNGILNEYIRLATEAGKKDADRYKQATEAALQSIASKEAELREQQKVAENVEQLKVKFKTLAETEAEVDLAQRKLYISAENNIEKLKETNIAAANTIADAWKIIGNSISDAELKAKTEAEYLKVVASGNMALAEKMAIGINNAAKQHPSGQSLDEYLNNNLLKEANALQEKHNALADMYKEKQKEIQALEAKGAARTEEEQRKLENAKKNLIQLEQEHAKEIENLHLKISQQIRDEEAKLASLQQGKNIEKQALMEINRLTAEQMSVQQLALLSYEATMVARQTGDKQAIAGVEALTRAIKQEADMMAREGKTSTTYYELLIKLMKGVVDGTYNLTEAKIKEMLAHADNADALKRELEVLEKGDKIQHGLLASTASLAGAVGSLAFAYQMCTGDTESNIGKLSEWAINSSVVISAAESMAGAIGTLSKAYKALAASAALAKLVTLAAAHPMILAGVVAAIGVAGVKFSLDDFRAKMEQKKKDDEDTVAKYMDRLQYREDVQHLDEIKKRTGLKNPTEEVDKKAQRAAERAAKEQERLQKQAEKAKNSYDELYNSILVANDGFASGITEEEKALDKLNKQLKQWEDKIGDLEKKGGNEISITDKDNMKNIVRIYGDLARAEAERNAKTKEYSNALQDIQNKETLNLLTTRQANEQRVKVLADQRKEIEERIALYSGASSKAAELQQKIREAETEEERKRLKLEYSYYKENVDKKLQAERDYAENVKAMREAMTTSGKIQWDEIANYVKNITFDQTATVKSGIDTLIGEFTSFGQNIIGSTKSVTEQLRDMCKNLMNDILNMMMKIYMQGLIMNLFSNIGSGSGKYYSNGSLDPMKVTSAKIGHNATGGLASGWSIVGEKGPELVNFSNPGRVYTAEQTRNALSGGNGNVNIKIDLHNESGQQLEAETTGSTFDGENYVLSVWLKAVSTNKNGVRNIIKGVATT